MAIRVYRKRLTSPQDVVDGSGVTIDDSYHSHFDINASAPHLERSAEELKVSRTVAFDASDVAALDAYFDRLGYDFNRTE